MERPRSPRATRPDVVDVADEHRLVEAQVVAQLGHRLRRGVLAQHEGDRVARDQLDGEHDHEDDAEQHRHGQEQAADDERQHAARQVRARRYLSSQTFPSQRLYSTGWIVKPLTPARVTTISLVL